MERIRIGSRESKLAMVQSKMIKAYIETHVPEAEVSILPLKTTGDRILDWPLEKIGGKGLFVKELDRALAAKETELSVHSLKDMPMEVPEEIPIIGYSKREDPRDVLVLPPGETEWDLTKPVGCTGKRRIVQLKRLHPEIRTELIRGNLQTRLRKLDEGQYGSIILAAAGLNRLELTDRITRYFSEEEMIPAAGQGILVVQGRRGLDYSYMDGFFDREATCCALAERAFVKELDGGCSSPIAAHAKVNGEELTLTGLYCEKDSFDYVTGTLTGSAAEAKEIGIRLARMLHGGKDGR